MLRRRSEGTDIAAGPGRAVDAHNVFDSIWFGFCSASPPVNLTLVFTIVARTDSAINARSPHRAY